MPSSAQSDRISSGKNGAKLLIPLIDLSLSASSKSDFLSAALEQISDHTQSSTVSVVRGVKGQWRVIAQTGSDESPPAELLAEALDTEICQQSGEWTAALLYPPNHTRPIPTSQLLAIHGLPITAVDFDSIAAALGLALESFQLRANQSRRAERLEAILEMTVHWNKSRQTDELLEQIALASTKLLGAERATIFLPSANGSCLIGKPALGVDGGEIRIPVSAGVVGQVMQSGRPSRVDSDITSEQQQIHRDIDQQLGFETRTILCVPMINESGKTIGAFELINRLEGNFTDEDESALCELAAHASVAIDNTQHVEQLVTSKRTVAQQAAGQVQMIGECPEIIQLKSIIEKVANTDLVILITGENGTGKEIVAQMIHYLSDRRDEVLVAVNCAAISSSLLESELFGHEKGAFTDAIESRAGKFELAGNGTLFLDEIGDMSLDGQSKLLRVLEEHIVIRVGGSTPIPTHARIVAATNQDLAGLISEKKFRRDLYFRLNVVPIELPPLRNRGDDILLLAEHFLIQFCAKARRETPSISAAARKRLLNHSWPGNIRELRNMMERLAFLTDGQKIEAADLAFVNAPSMDDSAIPMNLALTDATQQFQVDYIHRHIEQAKGNMTNAATKLGLHRSNLYRKMKQLGIGHSDDDQVPAGQ